MSVVLPVRNLLSKDPCYSQATFSRNVKSLYYAKGKVDLILTFERPQLQYVIQSLKVCGPFVGLDRGSMLVNL